jgi:hypothetical protein
MEWDEEKRELLFGLRKFEIKSKYIIFKDLHLHDILLMFRYPCFFSFKCAGSPKNVVRDLSR